ncbi:chromosome segregation protein SMC [Enterococcus sp. HY326]|uniref:chromosome segregation protein SMC n=1 Tax=Enterococcus sp. HY326 TaxID=2971265 RepID=UPI00223EDCD6|nr:chromosome segregation protein SMC [Enterococcus sp. HY326]
MYLKKVEIAGFKSFADRTVIDFENKLTAVVGPNGSGKSNITEAIRWVLGEQSAKSLRGGKMPDIIFAGSESRKPLNIAEVTIVLDNSDNYLPLDFSEISVTRRLRRTGESDFFINKQACRLKDIQDLFMDSGLGKESFSIISQGKVEAIFSSKPEDRRGIFEEAAGVLKYKQRKKKAEQKLFETEDNLSRVQDIIYELEDQLEPLKAQSAAAKEFLTLKEKLTAIDISAVITEVSSTKADWETKKTELAVLAEQLTEVGEAIQHAESKLFDLRQTRSQTDQQIDQFNQQQLQLTEALKQAEGQKDVLKERSQNTLKNAQEYQASVEEAEAKLAEFSQQLTDLRRNLLTKEEEMTLLSSEIAATESELIKYQKSSKEIIEDLRSQYVELMQEQASTNNELKHLERTYQQEMVKNQQALTKNQQLETQQAALVEQVADLTEKKTTVQDQIAKQLKDYQKTQQELQQGSARFKEAQQEMYQLMNRLQQVKARHKSLQDIQDNYTGFYHGVRLILQNQEQLGGIIGAVAELLTLPEDYTLAIETALGGAAQNIVVETEKDARNGITFLKERKGGRGTFLPLTTIKPRSLNSSQVKKAQDVPGFLGIASQLISYDDKIANIAENLLGHIVIAKDLTSANQLAKALNYQVRIVSLEGDVMNAGGSMTGGASKKGNQGSLFSQGQELQHLSQELERIEAQQFAKEQQVQQLEAVVKKQEVDLEALRSHGETTRLEEQEILNQLANKENELERAQKELQIFQMESTELQRFIGEYQQEKAELTDRQTTLATQLTDIDQEIKSISQESELVEETRQRLQEEKNQQTAKLAIAKEQKTHLESQLQNLVEQERDTANRRDNLVSQIAALSNASSDFEMTEESLVAQGEELSRALAEIKEKLSAAKEQRQALQEQVDQLDNQLTEANQQQKNLMATQTNLEVQKNRRELQLDNFLAYLQEEYSMTYEAAVWQYQETSDLTAAKKEVRQLKADIERLGPVNLNAIEQFEQVDERHQFLVSQRDDLLSAKEQLFTTMAEMDEEVKLRFSETFDAIRNKFKAVFPKMFGGGRAELFLTDPTDLLNTGIEIEAQPPGKRLQSLSLLSGGERALTAIALLFSIIQVRTVPFCILDEVEAALDEANVSRFGHYLSQFQSDTQFIVVTHRKGTMEAANVLYGVTMQESGVSKIVSVRLEDVTEGGRISAEAQ